MGHRRLTRDVQVPTSSTVLFVRKLLTARLGEILLCVRCMCLLISFSFRDGLIVAMPPPFSAAVLRGDTSGMSGIGGAMFPLDNDGEYDLVMNIIDQDFSYISPL